MAIDIHLKQSLEELDEKYGGEELYRIFGPTSLTWNTTDSSRMYMFTSHLKQTLTLLNPDVPRLATGMENSIGKFNNAYKRLQGTWEVKEIIPKFSFPEETRKDPATKQMQIFMMVLYNRKTDTYEMIEKPVAESLTEKFGFVYNTKFMESLKVGDRITDSVLYKSTSYDENMAYRYGKNARVFFSTSTDTIEDAIVIRKGWADTVKSVEIDEVQIPINDNDVLLNIYGDRNEYLAFPEVGQEVRDSLICATRRINRAHLLYDFQASNMQEVMDTDTDYYVGKHSVVYDINVYYNGDGEFPQNLFYQQLYRYYQDNCRYAEAVLDCCNRIKQSGSKYTQNVSYYRSIYLHWNDSEYKWCNKDKVFGNIILEIKVKSIVGLDLGSKMSGRFGNKGVISRVVDDTWSDVEDSIVNLIDDGTLTPDDKRLLRTKINIVDDERMPYYLQDGKRVYADVLCNSSGAIRRLNPGQLVEVEINFLADQVQYLIKKAHTQREKEDIFFRFMECVSKDECTFFRDLYDSYEQVKSVDGLQVRLMSPDHRKAFIQDVEENGFYIVRPPHKPLLFDDVIRVYDEFPEIKPRDIYVDLFGMKERKTLRPGVIGYMYMIILKQNSNKNFSARSTFRVNRSNLPAKDIAKKTNRSSYARTPVRLSEIYNLLASISGTDLAEYNIFLRSSALGRKSLDRILSATGNPLKIKKLKVQDNFTNANADILAAKLKTLGLRLYFSPNPEGRVQFYDDNTVMTMKFGDYMVVDHPHARKLYRILFDVFEEERKKFIMIETYPGEKLDVCWDHVFEREDIKNNEEINSALTEELKENLKVTTKGNLADLRRTIKNGNSRSGSSGEGSTHRRRGRRSKSEIEAQRRQAEAEELSEEEEEPEDTDEDEDRSEPEELGVEDIE